MSADENNESIISHLEALRTTLLKCIYSVVIVLPVAFYFAPKVLNWLISIILAGKDVTLNFFSPAEVFLIQIKTALVIDIIVCFPYIAKQLWNFLLPALYDNEKKVIKSMIFISTFLFVLGTAFCILFILPLIMRFGLSFATENIQAVFNISNVVNLTLWLSVIFGLMFQIPLVTFGLIKANIISYNSVAGKRPYIIVGLLIFSGILTPPDIVSQLMLAVPTYLLFESALLFSKFATKQDKIVD